MEDDDFINAVKELGAEAVSQGSGDSRIHLVVLAVVSGDVEDELRADVAGHDDDGVGEVYRAALRIGDASIVLILATEY